MGEPVDAARAPDAGHHDLSGRFRATRRDFHDPAAAQSQLRVARRSHRCLEAVERTGAELQLHPLLIAACRFHLTKTRFSDKLKRKRKNETSSLGRTDACNVPRRRRSRPALSDRGHGCQQRRAEVPVRNLRAIVGAERQTENAAGTGNAGNAAEQSPDAHLLYRQSRGPHRKQDVRVRNAAVSTDTRASQVHCALMLALALLLPAAGAAAQDAKPSATTEAKPASPAKKAAPKRTVIPGTLITL